MISRLAVVAGAGGVLGAALVREFSAAGYAVVGLRRNHKQRLVQFILTHAAGDGSLRMTQQQMARHLGTTREVVARLMQEFVSNGYVRSQRGSVTIRDLFALRRVVVPDPILR